VCLTTNSWTRPIRSSPRTGVNFMADTPPGKKYQPLLTIQDKRFNVAALSQYHLSLYISDVYFKIICVNPTTTQCLLLAVYKLAHESSHQRIQAINQLYQDHPILTDCNWSAVTLCIGNQQYTLIPTQLFQEKKVADYLNFTCPIGSNAIRHFTHSSLNVTVAFAMDPQLLNWFQVTYEYTQLYIIHQASSLIQGTWTYLRNHKPSLVPKVLVFVESSSLHITVIQMSELLYYNRFEYTSCDELLYYVLIVIRTLKLDTSLHEVILGGDINKRSPVYRKARNYIRRLTLMNTLPYMRFRSTFPKKMMTAHLDVLSVHLCHREP
jgi:Protein of unknown function (DUF3822)